MTSAASSPLAEQNPPAPSEPTGAPAGAAAREVYKRDRGVKAGGGLAEFPSERRIQILALGSLVAAVALNALLVGFGDARFVGLTIPSAGVVALLAAPLFLGAVAVVQRSMPFLGLTLATLVAATLLERPWEIEAWSLFGALLFGMSTLAFGELVHMTTRYEKMHEAIELAGEGEESLDHAVGEYLKTFAYVFGLTVALGGAVGLVYTALREFGPAQHRASLDYNSVYGFVGAAALLFTALLLLALARGADFSIPRREPKARGPDDDLNPDALDEVDADARR